MPSNFTSLRAPLLNLLGLPGPRPTQRGGLQRAQGSFCSVVVLVAWRIPGTGKPGGLPPMGSPGPSSSCVWNPRVFADDARGWAATAAAARRLRVEPFPACPQVVKPGPAWWQ